MCYQHWAGLSGLQAHPLLSRLESVNPAFWLRRVCKICAMGFLQTFATFHDAPACGPAVLSQTEVAAGALLGVIASQLTGRFLEELIEGATFVDLTTSSVLVFVFLGVAAVSIWTGTRRLAKLDVMSVLRTE